MFVGFVADVHIGNHKLHGGPVTSGINRRCRRVIDALAQARSQAERLVVLGDLFDTSHPSPQMIAQTMLALQPQSHLLLGNHDMVSTEPGDHALAPFTASPYFFTYEQPFCREIDGTYLLMVPFRPEPMTEWFTEAVGEALELCPTGVPKVLCFHGGVRDHNTPKYLWGSPDAIDADLVFDVMERAKVRYAACGNWHNARTWKRNDMQIWQVGALVPTGFDNEGHDYGGFLTLDTRAFAMKHHLLPTDRFLKVKASDLMAGLVRTDVPHVYLKVQLDTDAAAEDVRSWLADAGAFVEGDDFSPILGLSFTSVEENTEEQAAEAAQAARTASTLEGALREYIQSMPLVEGVDRAEVESKAMNYMARE